MNALESTSTGADTSLGRVDRESTPAKDRSIFTMIIDKVRAAFARTPSLSAAKMSGCMTGCLDQEETEVVQEAEEGDLWSAAIAAERAGNTARAKQLFYESSVELEAVGDLWSAAVCAVEAGDTARANELRRKAFYESSVKLEAIGDLWSAAVAAHKARDAVRAKRLRERFYSDAIGNPIVPERNI